MRDYKYVGKIARGGIWSAEAPKKKQCLPVRPLIIGNFAKRGPWSKDQAPQKEGKEGAG